jgi:replicative DNA helicase
MQPATNRIDALLAGVPPQDEEAERGFIGGLLRHSKYLDELETAVPIESLHNPRLRIIYATILDMREDNEPIDAVTVADRMRETKRLEVAGGEAELLALIGETMTGALTQHYAGIIIDHWKRRQIVSACTDAMREAYAMTDPMEIQSRLEASMQAVEAAKADAVIFDGFDVANEVVDEIRRRKSEGRTAVGVPTGFYDLDNLTSGLVPGELFIVGARPSQGKTALAANMLLHASQHCPVLFVSIEMGRCQIMQRMLSGMTGVNSVKVRHATVNDQDIDRMKDATARLRGGKFWIADVPGANIAEVVQVSRQVKRRRPDLGVVAVDYMQLIRHENRRMPRHEQVADISGRLKALARSLNVCVVALSQLNRESEGKASKRPEMSNLRESGAVEQDADVIALIHRPEFNNPEDRPGEADLIVCKVRNGPIGDVLLHFDKGTTTFKNSTSHQIAPMSTQRFDSAADF